MAKRLAKLKKELYNAARRCIPANYQDDKEAVKAKRDQVTNDIFEKHYADLTAQEMQICIDELDMQSGTIQPKKHVASGKQVKMLNGLAITYGLAYHDFENVEHYDLTTSQMLTGETLRRRLIRGWMDKSLLIPKNILHAMYTETVNPKLNNLLLEQGFKKYIKNPAALYYASLSPAEAQALIKRLKQMSENIHMNWRQQPQPNYNLN